MDRCRSTVAACATTLVTCWSASAQELQAPVVVPNDAQPIVGITRESHQLRLESPDDYRMKPSPQYLLRGRWGKPAPLPVASPPAIQPYVTAVLPFHDDVLAAARSAGIEPALIHAVIQVESAYDATAVSPKGAVGLMQSMPDTAKRYGVKNSRDPVQNIRGGARYLADLSRIFDGDLSLVLAAYNAGEKAVIRFGRSIPKFPETLEYVPRVLAQYEGLRDRLRIGL